MAPINYKHLFLVIGFGFINCFQLTAGEPATTTIPKNDVLQALMTRLKTLQHDFLLEMDKFIQKQQALHKKLIECETILAAQFKIISDLKAKKTPIKQVNKEDSADKKALNSAKKNNPHQLYSSKTV